MLSLALVWLGLLRFALVYLAFLCFPLLWFGLVSFGWLLFAWLCLDFALEIGSERRGRRSMGIKTVRFGQVITLINYTGSLGGFML